MKSQSFLVFIGVLGMVPSTASFAPPTHSASFAERASEHFQLARTYSKNGHHEEAIKQLVSAQLFDSNNKVYLTYEAMVRNSRARQTTDGSLKAYDLRVAKSQTTRVLQEIDPSYDLAYSERAKANYYLKDYDAAISDYSSAIDLNLQRQQSELDPQKRQQLKGAGTSYRSARGNSFYGKKWFDAAFFDYSTAAKEDPNNQNYKKYAEMANTERQRPVLDMDKEMVVRDSKGNEYKFAPENWGQGLKKLYELNRDIREKAQYEILRKKIEQSSEGVAGKSSGSRPSGLQSMGGAAQDSIDRKIAALKAKLIRNPSDDVDVDHNLSINRQIKELERQRGQFK